MSIASSAATGGSVSSIENDDISLSSSKFGDNVAINFDGSLPSKKQSFVFVPKSANEGVSEVCVELECADEEPGAVQSGHFLWPAAPALSQHLVDTYGSVPMDTRQNFPRIVELGAGCGLPSLAALQVFRKAQCVVISDYDPNTLTRARHNYNYTTAKLRQIETKGTVSEIGEESSFSFPSVMFEELRWGDELAAKRLIEVAVIEGYGDEKLSATKDGGGGSGGGDDEAFDLILASDVIYEEPIVLPLLESASVLLSKSNGDAMMIMSQSFPYDEETEATIDGVCDSLGLIRAVVSDNLAEEGGNKIQTFRFKQ